MQKVVVLAYHYDGGVGSDGNTEARVGREKATWPINLSKHKARTHPLCYEVLWFSWVLDKNTIPKLKGKKVLGD